MACSSHRAKDEGYATAAATMMSLAIAVAASAVSAMALGELHAARSDIHRTQAVAALDGGQLLAAFRIIENGSPGRLSWQETGPGGPFKVLAEPEQDKVNVALAVSDLDLLRRLGATNPQQTEAWLRTELAAPRPRPLSLGDAAKLWRACAPSMISYQGRADHLALASAHEPDRDAMRPHVGEVWRVVVSSGGMSDDRLVRITGNGQMPAATILRRFGPTVEGGEQCGSLTKSS